MINNFVFRVRKSGETAIFDLVDYFPYLNRYEAGIVNQEVEKAE